MKKTLALIGALCLAAVTLAQSSSTGISGYYDLKSKDFSTVVTRPIGSLQHILGSKYSLDVLGFGGLNTHTHKPILGSAVGYTFKAAANLDIFAGGAITVAGGAPVSGGFMVAGVWRF